MVPIVEDLSDVHACKKNCKFLLNVSQDIMKFLHHYYLASNTSDGDINRHSKTTRTLSTVL